MSGSAAHRRHKLQQDYEDLRRRNSEYHAKWLSSTRSAIEESAADLERPKDEGSAAEEKEGDSLHC